MSRTSSTALLENSPARVENRELLLRWQKSGDRRAREELVSRVWPLARNLARRYAGAREPFDDLLQVASLGLVKAIDRFDVERGAAFSSFAVPTILGELKRYFRDLGWSVHVPRGAQEQALKVQEAHERLTTKTGRPPTVNELAEYLELSVEDVLDALETAAAQLATMAGARLSGGTVSWWFHPRIPPGNSGALYLGMALLSAGWLGLWRHAREPRSTPIALLPVAVLWTAPLLAGAPLFSHDAYSYLAQGTVAHLGLSPYHVAPGALGALGHAGV